MAARKKSTAKKSTAKKIDRFHAVAGSDEGQVRSAAYELFYELAENPDDEFSNETIDGAAENSEAAFQICRKTSEALRTLPFFGTKVVWLRNATFLADGVTGNAERTQEGLQLLRETLEAGLPEGIAFLISASNPDKRRSFWHFLKASADLRLFDKIDMGKPGWEDQVAGMILRQSKGMGLSFASGALDLFIILVGVDSGRIANELEKIDLYLGPDRREITETDVREMVPMGSAGIVFEIGNAIQHGNAARAIELIDKQIDMHEKGASTAAIGIIRASIIPTVRNLFMAAVLLDGQNIPLHNYSAFKAALEKLPQNETNWLPRSKKTGAINAYPIFLAAKQASRFPLAHLREALESCARADRDLVSTTRAPRLVLHHLIVSLALPAKKKSNPRGGRAA